MTLDIDDAQARDQADELSAFRDMFELPKRTDGATEAYFAGNSLGAMPKPSRTAIETVLDSWSHQAVAGHFAGEAAWYRADEPLAASMALLVGAKPSEVALSGTLTTNLHLLMASFYRPTRSRRKILIEAHAFPSDRYAVASQVAWHGGDPATDVVTIPSANPDRTTVADVEKALNLHGDSIAMALIGGLNYYTGQLLPMEAIAARLRALDIVVGYDLAHVAGNVPVQLHDWDVDFAAWCTYKYLNAGPGAIAALFVHQRHGDNPNTPRLAGWWGNDPELRFEMHAEERFVPMGGAGGWKISNPSVLSMAPLAPSLALFEQAGFQQLRQRSKRMTAFLERGLETIPGTHIITPTDPDERGCQLSLRVRGEPGALEHRLAQHGVVVAARDPDIIRLAPAPLYNSYEDIVHAVAAVRSALAN